MDDNSFPHSAETIVATLIEVFERQNINHVADLLRSAQPRVEETGYDNWDGGTYFHSLYLEVPTDVFSEIEPRITEIEETVLEKIKTIIRVPTNRHITEVVVAPQLTPNTTPTGAVVADEEADHLWTPRCLRLFLSHVAIHKEVVGMLKNALGVYGISAFVAHEDIEPNAVWQSEIWKALQSMHAMAALLTPEFHESKWTDQEIGVALGKHILVIPVRLGLDPYGFVGIHQGLAGDLQKPSRLASQLTDVLLKQESTATLTRESLVVSLEESISFAASKTVSAKIADINDFTDDQLDRLEKACSDNYQVKKSFDVPERIHSVVRRQRPIDDDDLPF